eukprot:1156876-Pelagomonas_calceolata.AAC.2
MARWVWGHRAVGALSCEIHQSTMKGFESHWFPPAVGDDKPLFLPRSLLKCSPYDTGVLSNDLTCRSCALTSEGHAGPVPSKTTLSSPTSCLCPSQHTSSTSSPLWLSWLM